MYEPTAGLTNTGETSLVGSDPDHAPDAVQEVVLVLLHVIAAVWPSVIEEGATAIETAGAGAGLTVTPQVAEVPLLDTLTVGDPVTLYVVANEDPEPLFGVPFVAVQE